MISMWIFRIVCSYILVMVLDMGVLGVWIGMFVDWYARAAAYLAMYLSGRWKKHRMI
jgi:Na+-driven multidrug efflux pump